MGWSIFKYNLEGSDMVEDIENIARNEMKMDITKENLEFFGDLMPLNSVLVINLADYKDRARFSADHICSGLKEALGTPHIRSINVAEASIILYDDDGRKGLFMANRVPDKQARIGLPGFIPDSSRSYYGVIWGEEDEPRVYSSFGSELFGKEDHRIEAKDIPAIHSLYYTISDFALKVTTDPIARKRKHELLGIRTRSMDIY